MDKFRPLLNCRKRVFRAYRLKNATILVLLFILVLNVWVRLPSKPEGNRITKLNVQATPILTPELASALYFEVDEVKAIPYETIIQNFIAIKPNPAHAHGQGINWSKYAYVQYATDLNYLTSAIFNFNRLIKMNTKSDLVILYASTIDNKNSKASTQEQTLLQKAGSLGIKVHKVDLIKYKSDSKYWDASFTKFNLFKLTQYSRIVYFDSDSLVLKKMDELFFLPDSMIYAPANYISFRDFNEFPMDLTGIVQTWLERDEMVLDIFDEHISKKDHVNLKNLFNALPSMKSSIELLDEYGFDFQLGNYIMVVEPSLDIFNQLIELSNNKKENQFDMDIFNELINLKHTVNNNVYKSSQQDKFIPFVSILPHKPYGLLTGEFKEFERAHDCYLTDPQDLPFLSYKYPNQFLNYEDQDINFKSDKKKSKEDVKIEDNLNENPNLPYWSFQNKKVKTNYGWLSNFILDDTKLIHFSDHPVPKPWYDVDDFLSLIADDLKKVCRNLADPINHEGCDGVKTWLSVYKEYKTGLEELLAD